jgi:neutral ceramidase
MLLTSGAAAIAAPGQLVEIGFASVDVTPPIGHRMSGYFYERFSTGVHNPLQAKAIVFRQGDERFAWVFCDLLGVPSTVSSVVRNSAAAETGIPRQNIFIAATHTHTGPLYFGPLRDFFHAQTIKLTGKDEHEATDYARELTGKLTELIAAAAAATKPTELSLAVVPQPGLAFNRRYILKDGSVATNPGKLNPNIARPAGPTDVDLSLLHFRRQAKPVACLSLFALHLDTTGGADYAADFPFYLERDPPRGVWERVSLDLRHRHVRRRQSFRRLARSAAEGPRRIRTDWRHDRRHGRRGAAIAGAASQSRFCRRCGHHRRAATGICTG